MPTSTLTQEAGGTKLMLPEEINEKDIAMIKNIICIQQELLQIMKSLFLLLRL